jgi:hypothetical protein
MLVVRSVATDAGVGRLLVVLVDMTGRAFRNLCVRTGQGVARGELVVEARIAPRCFPVALGAGFAEVAVVPIVLLVARNALALRVVKGLLRGVAIRALQLRVPAEQSEVREAVVELKLV